MKVGTTTKQPGERLSYTVDYTDALPLGDNLSTATATVSPSGLNIFNVGVYDPRVKVWLDGGTDGVTYVVTIEATSIDGRIYQDELTVKIKEV